MRRNLRGSGRSHTPQGSKDAVWAVRLCMNLHFVTQLTMGYDVVLLRSVKIGG